jgi:hypothetical protein
MYLGKPERLTTWNGGNTNYFAFSYDILDCQFSYTQKQDCLDMQSSQIIMC